MEILAKSGRTDPHFAPADCSRIRNADLRRLILVRLMKMLSALPASLRLTLQVDARDGGEASMGELKLSRLLASPSAM